MFFEIQHIAIDYDRRTLSLTENPNPVFTWSALHGQNGAYQSAYSVTVCCEGKRLWKSGEVRTSRQRAVYAGAPLCSGEVYEVILVLQDQSGDWTAPKSARFRFLDKRQWTAKWITSEQQKSAAKYFYKGFQLEQLPIRATLYASGIGYQYLTVNGVDVEKSFLNPAVSHYKKLCYYTVTDVTDALRIGKNGIFAIVGDGWRDPKGFFESKQKQSGFFAGGSQLIAELELQFADGSRRLLATDESWLAGEGPIVENSLFNGETYDARKTIPLWDTPDFTGAGMVAAAVAQETVGELCPQTLPPVTQQERLKARVIRRTADGIWIFDFGVNIAGVCCLSVPAGIAPGTCITIEHAEEILPDGDLDKETLRLAKVTDTFIAGKENPSCWMPRLTYHGFRYVKLSGYPGLPNENTLEAIAFCNDVQSRSFFRCGDPLVNQLQENILRTEKNNLHHLATDCPQRDERMGWMNDATVRFEESPYNFYMGRLFPKILKDVALDQSEETGSITDTAPSVWGSQPADPVCSSFLVMGLEMALHYGDTEMIRQYYVPFKRWNQCLAQLCNAEGIIEYSSYGDWAGPADCCNSIFDGQHSAVTPGALMSTGYHYYNYKLLAQFAGLLGDTAEQEEAEEKAEQVRNAFLNKWFDPQRGYVHNGSQGAQAFALWLGILPPEYEKLAARRMREGVKNVGYRLTTGNLTTKYLMDMLTKYGYADTAWKLLTRQEYPSWGYMIQNGATTVWERFECKRGSGMNSHDHPMYGAVGYWFYAYLLGITPVENGWQRFRVMPCYPEELLYAEGRVDTEAGEIYVRWQRQMGSIDLLVDVPFGTEATVVLPEGERIITSGCHDFHFDE